MDNSTNKTVPVDREYLGIPGGIEYIEFQYFDETGKPVPREQGVTCKILECAKDGTVLRTVEGSCKKSKTERLKDFVAGKDKRRSDARGKSRLAVLWGKLKEKLK